MKRWNNCQWWHKIRSAQTVSLRHVFSRRPTLQSNSLWYTFHRPILSILSILSIIYFFRDAPFDIWGGGGATLKLKKIVCRHKSQKKKVCWKCEQKKMFVVEIDEKYVDQKKHQMVTYIIGKAYDKKFLRHNIKKKNVGRSSPKKSLFSTGGKKKSLQATKTLGPPPPRYQMVRPLGNVTLQRSCPAP